MTKVKHYGKINLQNEREVIKMRAVKYEYNGRVYNTLAEAPKGSKVILVTEVEPIKVNPDRIARRRAAIRAAKAK